MKFLGLTTLLALPLAMAAPAAELVAGNVFICTQSGWSGECRNLFVGAATGDWRTQCQRLPENYVRNIGSAGPDAGALCRLFDNDHSDCTGSGLAILSRPGSDNLGAAGRQAVYISEDGGNKYASRARDLNQQGLDEQEQEVVLRKHQIERPWHRQDADKPPVDPKGHDKKREEPLSKGKLLTTPTRLLKLILPLPVSVEKNSQNNEYNDSNSKDFGRSISSNDKIQPLALLIHPQQPLSYVERLIQAELPPVVENGKEKIPSVYFRAEDTGDADNAAQGRPRHAKKKEDKSRSPHVASYSGLGHEAESRDDKEKRWVRWSSSTEMGDFIRDAARGREFAIEVEGYNLTMHVGVPSFADRTHYMRSRLRRMSRSIARLTDIKSECDKLAHRGAHRLAQGGFAMLSAWWGVVYYVTFHTEAGWDLVEPITYLAGLTTIMGGYLWFLYISRDLSYKAAMNITVSRRREALYEARGFDVPRWERLVREANALRAEVAHVASEYDVDWDEKADLGGSEEVKEVLEAERHKQRKRSAEDSGDEDEGGDAGSKDKKSSKTEKQKEADSDKDKR
ncbi:uncharacterized protein PpBr36_10120 [Pyricularia pennisetigena]|uniref:uncharacterized protein n=1 Tax=Pyricularia pennisetigena TaxID=1578925 RepID=UPI0011540B5E|nr:uncharacterized protein PpBr36_10120 [Pyricularia pennisetigena]TLS21429.1 hypothetical protein PpBr36_10120 [Pyricularia pennisetigena]